MMNAYIRPPFCIVVVVLSLFTHHNFDLGKKKRPRCGYWWKMNQSMQVVGFLKFDNIHHLSFFLSFLCLVNLYLKSLYIIPLLSSFLFNIVSVG